MDKIGFWRAPGNSQSYLNMLYLLISYPLGIIYFVFIITGLALGFGLFITWFGIPILVGVMFVWLGFAHFERGLAKTFLKIEIPYFGIRKKEKGIWETLKRRFADSYTWKSFGYLMLKFPLGILGFVILVTFISITISFILAPFGFGLIDSGVIPQATCSGSDWCWTVSWPVAIFVGFLGILMIFISMAIFNGLSKAYGSFAQVTLSNRREGMVKKKSTKKISKKKSNRKTKKKKGKK